MGKVTILESYDHDWRAVAKQLVGAARGSVNGS